jgi:hypothetical protein
MEVSSNGGRPQPIGQVNANGPESSRNKNSKKDGKGIFSLRILWIVLLVGIAVLIIAVIASVVNSTFKSEDSFVNPSQYQAVFVNVTGSSGGQAYFGHIKAINSQYIQLDNVFYLEPGSSNNQFTLNNLSCALYNPQDTMIIKTAQVAFWENLKPNSQVTTDINKWYTDNLQCSTNKSGSTATPKSGTSGTGTTGTGTTGAPVTGTPVTVPKP